MEEFYQGCNGSIGPPEILLCLIINKHMSQMMKRKSMMKLRKKCLLKDILRMYETDSTDKSNQTGQMVFEEHCKTKSKFNNLV